MTFRLNSPNHFFRTITSVLFINIIALAVFPFVDAELELDTNAGLVECVECVQLWRSAAQHDTKVCGPHAKTCKANACFMRQCKHCPVYQYMSGCVDLSPWQIADLEMNRRRSELRMRRVGAMLLCEDTFNHTTCICNRKDKCNSIHARLPFSTYGEGIFRGVANFDQIIGDLDPRYLEVITGYQYRFGRGSTACIHHLLVVLLLIVIVLINFA
ncbi:hypothetical protein DICVIV_04127 [Dictyocaulus viviparus]|uniref:Uncharacterized protein n=1 Tax=Dictyocaulus viviparus TaxID=29172 RepID=A0A0D8Y585_DICVI|nr:hypothetical protein DICVIV_04127 [Dictyocaulus viviparus]